MTNTRDCCPECIDRGAKALEEKRLILQRDNKETGLVEHHFILQVEERRHSTTMHCICGPKIEKSCGDLMVWHRSSEEAVSVT